MSETRNRFRGMARLLSLAGPAAKVIITAGIIGISASPAEPAETSLRISIYVYNVAQVPQGLLRSAEQSAAKIFEEAGIGTTWREPHSFIPEDLEAGSRGDPWIPTNIALRIYERPMISELSVEEGALGFVLRFETHSAVILYDRVRDLALSKRIEVAPILGISIAHEIGHLLLRSREHSSEGIMRRNWSSTNLQSAAQSGLHFTAEQARRIRDEVLRWSAQIPEAGLTTEVHVYNYSAVSAQTLARAEQETVRIFDRTGVAIAWLACPRTSEDAVWNKACAVPDALPRLTLRLLPNSIAESFGSDKPCCRSWRMIGESGQLHGFVPWITLDLKCAGARSAGNPHATCDVAGARTVC